MEKFIFMDPLSDFISWNISWGPRLGPDLYNIDMYTDIHVHKHRLPLLPKYYTELFEQRVRIIWLSFPFFQKFISILIVALGLLSQLIIQNTTYILQTIVLGP